MQNYLQYKYIQNLQKREAEYFKDFEILLDEVLYLLKKYDPNQPRVPAGSGRESGRGAKIDGYSESKVPDSWANKDSKIFQRHVNDHKADFNSKSGNDYAKKAQKFRLKAAKEKLPAVESSEKSGKKVKIYDAKTNTFAVYDQDGKTRTFYKPKEKNYFDNEVKKVISNGGRKIDHSNNRGGLGGGRGLPLTGEELWNEYIFIIKKLRRFYETYLSCLRI